MRYRRTRGPMDGAPGTGVPGMPQNPGAAPMGAYAPAGTSAGNNWAVYQQAQAKPGQVPPQQQQAGIPIRKVRPLWCDRVSLVEVAYSSSSSSRFVCSVACHGWSAWRCPRRCPWQLVVRCCPRPGRDDGQQTKECHDDRLGAWYGAQFRSPGEWERHDDGWSIGLVGPMAATARCDACQPRDGQQQYAIVRQSEEPFVAWQLCACGRARVRWHARRRGEANEFGSGFGRGRCRRPYERQRRDRYQQVEALFACALSGAIVAGPA